jgi:Family of unknown function (DUF6152)
MKRSMTYTARQAIILVSLIAGGTTLALAHHSYSAFDMSTEKVVTGTIKKVDWTNPHTWIWVDVANDKGVVETWGFEGMSPNYLERRGWTRKTLSPGDKVSVRFHPMKNGERGGSFLSATLPDGSPLRNGGAITDPN